MLNVDAVRAKIWNSLLNKGQKYELEEWYITEYNKIGKESLDRLAKVRQWRESKQEKLQKKVLRRLK
jgi:phage-related minor tail protein